MSLPYCESTPVWWHAGDERFYENKDNVNSTDYMLVPIDEWSKIKLYEELIQKAIDGEEYTVGAGFGEGCYYILTRGFKKINERL